MATDNKCWKVMSSCPFGRIPDLSNLIKIDSDHFIIVHKGVGTFDTDKNTWKVEHQQILRDIDGQTSASCYNDITKQIYIPQKLGTMKIFNLETKELSKSDAIGAHFMLSRGIIIDGICHVLGGVRTNSHQIYDKSSDKYKLVHNFNEYQRGFVKFDMVYHKGMKEILLLGGIHCGLVSEPSDYIFNYSLTQKKWTKMEATLPRKMYGFGCIITNDQQYVFILGGAVGDDKALDEIWILKLKTMTWEESAVKIPFKGFARAIIMDDTKERDLLVHGFVRRVTDNSDMNIPFAVIGLIANWRSPEYIHVIREFTASHWKIHVGQILRS